MMQRATCMMILIAFVGCASATHSPLPLATLKVPAGYYISETAAVPNHVVADIPFQVTVDRAIGDVASKHRIELAESLYPTAEIVRRSAEARPPRDPKNALGGSSLWWDSDFDGVRIPYAVTGDAVRYYLELSEAFRRGEASSTGIRMLASNFQYVARVENYSHFSYGFSNFSDVTVVRLVLRWSNYCGELCALWIDRERIVVFSRSGEIIAVFGDSHYSPMVS